MTVKVCMPQSYFYSHFINIIYKHKNKFFMKTFYTIIFYILLVSSALVAQDGTLDTSFGTNGVAIIDNGTDNAEILSLTKSDTKLTGAGFTSSGGTEVFTVVRFNLDGSLDTGFGTDG